jgi:uncharacterized protein YegP (UPF0339 family)
MVANFMLNKGSTGKVRFKLVPINGQVIVPSEGYEQASVIRLLSPRAQCTKR